MHIVMKRNIYKNIIKVVIVAALVQPISSCSRFLDAESPSIVTDDFYDTKDGQEKLIVDIYTKFRNVFNTTELQYYGTDLYMAITESEVERMFNGYDKTFNSTAPVVGGYWNNLYKIVQQSNILLSRISADSSGEDYNEFEAKGKFFRALAYYYLVETFGDVPLYTTEQTEVINEVVRTTESEIYSTIIADLEDVKGDLGNSNVASGEVNGVAVNFLLGKLYLTRAYKSYKQASDFGNAHATFNTIINNPNFSLLPSYSSVYDENNQNNKEVIWAMQYGADKNYVGGGNPQHQLFGFNITALEPNMFIRNQSDYSAMNRGYWVIPNVHEYFSNPELDTRYDATFKRSYTINNSANVNFGKLGIFFPRWNDESNDDHDAVKFYPFKSGDNYNWLPQSTALPILNNAIDRMPMINKFKDTRMNWGGAGTREDVIFRLSDVYLLAAEAYLGDSNPVKALEYINIIRRRAAIDETAYNDYLRLSAINIDVILDERARELLGEHDRWFDLKRTGTLLSRVKANNPFVQKYDNLSNMHLLRPIPQDEINKTNGLTQNNGYN